MCFGPFSTKTSIIHYPRTHWRPQSSPHRRSRRSNRFRCTHRTRRTRRSRCYSRSRRFWCHHHPPCSNRPDHSGCSSNYKKGLFRCYHTQFWTDVWAVEGCKRRERRERQERRERRERQKRRERQERQERQERRERQVLNTNY